MKNYRQQLIVLLCSLVLTFTGCVFQKLIHPNPQVEAIQQEVARAREDFEAVSKLNVQDKYPEEFQEAERQLQAAEADLKTLQECTASQSPLKRAKIPDLSASVKEKAGKSRATAQAILMQYYLDTIAPMVGNAEKKLDEIVETDTENPLGDELRPVIDKISTKVDEVQRGQKILTLTEVLEDIETMIQANTTLGSNVQKTIPFDSISFNTGEYELTAAGKQAITKLIEPILAARNEVMQHHREGKISIHIKTMGYTDEEDFRKETDVINALPATIHAEIPQDRSERRKFLNHHLSVLRAQNVSDYITQQILQVDPQALVNEEVVGKGEDIPSGVSAPFPVSDTRRRICKIYGYILVE